MFYRVLQEFLPLADDGTAARRKARLVVRGFIQQYGINYEMFPLLVRCPQPISSLYQMDLTNAFLHSLYEVIYNAPPPEGTYLCLTIQRN